MEASNVAAAPGVGPSHAAAEPAEAAVAEVTAPEWCNRASYTPNLSEWIKVRLASKEGQAARLARTANVSIVNFDLHGDDSGPRINCEQRRDLHKTTGGADRRIHRHPRPALA